MNEIPEWPTVGNGCECWVNPNPWTYYGIPEPGDCTEYNPDCPEHGETREAAALDALHGAPRKGQS